ncbi:hypothetical protein D623_10002837 [Myotis brandtii]|uniref:Uncharacterized protein n=1 Tax=Myotis brandtii TaxID=109478 RepID=S7MX09_MYOBR|nr:hypothetical protein D623_10002837 [Myotis brandtii]
MPRAVPYRPPYLGLRELAADKILRVFPISILPSEPSRRKTGSKAESGVGYREGTKKDLLGRGRVWTYHERVARRGPPKTLKDALLHVEEKVGRYHPRKGAEAIPLQERGGGKN